MHHGDVSPEIASGLLALKKQIATANIPPSQLDENFNFAVWNIREFGKKPRTEAAIHYIAEVLGTFDLVAIVELRDNLGDLGCVLPILGPSWDVVYSDWIPDAGGNRERAAFLFDRRAVTFNGLAAEIDAPRGKKETEYLADHSFWRAPYMCSFRSGNFDFIAIAVHTRWGDNKKGRTAELHLLADWIDKRFKDQYVEDHDLIFAGDVNTPGFDDETFQALVQHGLQVPDALKVLKMGDLVLPGSNLGKDARYDQILHLPTPAMKDHFSNVGGALSFYPNDKFIDELFPGKNYKREQFSYQLSDHFPVWLQIRTDVDGQRLDQIVQNGEQTQASAGSARRAAAGGKNR